MELKLYKVHNEIFLKTDSINSLHGLLDYWNISYKINSDNVVSIDEKIFIHIKEKIYRYFVVTEN